MIVCDRCKDLKKVVIYRYRVCNIPLYEHNKFAIDKDAVTNDDNRVAEIDLCQECAPILKRNLITTVFDVRKGNIK